MRIVGKYLLYGTAALLLVVCSWQCEMIIYGIGQGIGQAGVLWNARPIDEIKADLHFPDSLKSKLELVQQARDFAIDSLGINDSKSYKTVYDQDGEPILWVVTASDRFGLVPYEWDYPFLGKLGYKGFFNKQKAEMEAKALQQQGYDADVGEVNAWSTLGWFSDPILSNTLAKSEGELASLIIHELTHATLYVPDDAEFNENLATFVGDQGAFVFLAHKYGRDSREYRNYSGRLSDVEHFAKHVLRGAERLDSLYSSFDQQLPAAKKLQLKAQLIRNIFADADTISFYNKQQFARFLNPDYAANNTFFVDFRLYRRDQTQLKQEFTRTYNSDFRQYLAYLKKKYS